MGFLFLLFELCECLRIVVSDYLSIREGLPSRSHHNVRPGSEASLQSQSSTPNMSCRNGILVCNGDNNHRRSSRDIKLQKNDNVTNKALLIEGDANGFVRPHRDCAIVMDSLQFMSRLKTVSFSCELNTPRTMEVQQTT